MFQPTDPAERGRRPLPAPGGVTHASLEQDDGASVDTRSARLSVLSGGSRQSGSFDTRREPRAPCRRLVHLALGQQMACASEIAGAKRCRDQRQCQQVALSVAAAKSVGRISHRFDALDRIAELAACLVEHAFGQR